MSLIYLITNDINDKKYVGQTVTTLKRRWQHHLDNSKLVIPDGDLGKDIKKYGAEHFTIQELCKCTSKEDLNAKEQYYIDYYDSINNGYNILRAGTKGTSKSYPEEDIVKDYYSGLGVNKLSNKYNIPVTTIYNLLKRNNVIMRKQSGGAAKGQNGTPVNQYDLKTGELLNTYPSMGMAGEALGDKNKYKHIREVCAGKRKSAYGYFWAIAKEEK